MSLELIFKTEMLSGLVLVVGACTALYYNRSKLLHLLHKWRINSLLKDSNMKIHIVTSSEEWDTISPHITDDAHAYGALGFDCEWIQVQGKRRPVALLQLATASGICVLVRLSQMKSNIPASLKIVLSDKNVLKLGVGCIDDSKFLFNDYGLTVSGCVDLRHIYFGYANLKLQKDNSIGLNGLSQKLLGKSLDKDWRVRRGDWEAPNLTRRQIAYAAEDALVGIHILIKLLDDKLSPKNSTEYIISQSSWKTHVKRQIQRCCCHYSVLSFCYPKKDSLVNKTTITKTDQEPNGVTVVFNKKSPTKTKKVENPTVRRQTNIFHKCQLLAPDSTPLTKVYPKKANWYIENGLGILVSEEPLVVKLKSEPARNPRIEFYQLCVVCGKGGSFIKYNIVPLEVRKYFSDILKSHQIHNKYQLCLQCHQKSIEYENSLRTCLTKEFDTQTHTNSNLIHIVDQDLRRVQIAGGTLLKKGSKLSTERSAGLLKVLKDYYQCDNITTDLIKAASILEIKITNVNYEPYGLKVYRAYEKIGITKFTRRCRDHFISTMNPKFIPEDRSMDQYEHELEIRMNRLPQDHPNHRLYKIALIGTEGNLDTNNDHKLHKEHLSDNATETKTYSTSLVFPNKCTEESSDENK